MTKQTKSDLTTSLSKSLEEQDLVPRFWFCLLFTFPFLVRNLEPFIQWVLATIILLVGNWTFFYKAWHNKLSTYSLYSIAIALLYCYSLIGKAPLYGTMAALTVLVLLIRLTERAIGKQQQLSLQKLIQKAPRTAHKLLIDGRTEKVLPDALKEGDTIRVQMKDCIACDGIIFSGECLVDESAVTGKKEPLQKVVGSTVYAGTVLLKGSCLVRAIRPGKKSLFYQVIDNTERLIAKELPLEERVRGFSSQIVVAVIVVSLIVLLFSSLFTTLSNAILLAATLLVGLSPSALIFSAALLSKLAVAEAADEGIIVQNPQSFDKAAIANVLVANKNGTLTVAKPEIVSIDPVEGVSPNELVATAASLEVNSQHPYAACIIQKAVEKTLLLEEVADLKQIPGLGMQGKIGESTALIGDEKLMGSIDLGYHKVRAEDMRNQGYIVLFCAKGQKLLGIIVLKDPIRADVQDTLKAFKEEGVQLFCLSGDRRVTVVQLVNALGFDRFQAEASSEEKVQAVVKLQREGKCVLLVANPANAKDALIRADVGAALSMDEDAPIVLLEGTLSSSRRLIALSQKVADIWTQNSIGLYLFMALMGILTLFGSLGPTHAAFYLLLVTFAVGINTVRITK